MPGRWSTTQKRERPVANDPPGAMPSIIEPELATLASRPPASGDWSYEIKYKYAPRSVLPFEGLSGKGAST